jgi:hypothetical protein
VQCELPQFSCPQGKVPNSDNTACEATTTTTTPAYSSFFTGQATHVATDAESFRTALRQDNAVIDLQADVVAPPHQCGGRGCISAFYVPDGHTVTVFSSAGRRTIDGNKQYACIWAEKNSNVKLYDLNFMRCAGGAGAAAIWAANQATLTGTGLLIKDCVTLGGGSNIVFAWYSTINFIKTAMIDNSGFQMMPARGGGITLDTVIIENFSITNGGNFAFECNSVCSWNNVYFSNVGEMRATPNTVCPGTFQLADSFCTRSPGKCKSCDKDPIVKAMPFLQAMNIY